MNTKLILLSLGTVGGGGSGTAQRGVFNANDFCPSPSMRPSYRNVILVRIFLGLIDPILKKIDEVLALRKERKGGGRHWVKNIQLRIRVGRRYSGFSLNVDLTKILKHCVKRNLHTR